MVKDTTRQTPATEWTCEVDDHVCPRNYRLSVKLRPWSPSSTPYITANESLRIDGHTLTFFTPSCSVTLTWGYAVLAMFYRNKTGFR